MLLRTGDAFPACELSADGIMTHPEVLGRLEEKQRYAFDLLRQEGEFDAATLQAIAVSGERVGHTAWNNRLAALAQKGLVIEVQQGRSKTYRPVLPGI